LHIYGHLKHFREDGLQVSGVAFDSYWSSPTSDGTEENVMYRFGSVGQVICAIIPPSQKRKEQVLLMHDKTKLIQH
jgi:hypothetical protein